MTQGVDTATTGNWAFGSWVLRLPSGPLLRDDAPQPIGGRALDVLTLLVRRQGAVVSTQDLLDHVWAGRAVEEGNLYVHISELRKLLGREAIHSVYGRGYQLTLSLAAVTSAPSREPPKAATPAAREVAAGAPGTLYGRDAELAAVHRALVQHALVSIVGMGGIGKSALARAVAQDKEPASTCVVGFAALPRAPAGADDAAALAPLAAAVLLALRLPAGSEPPSQRLLRCFSEPAGARPMPGLLVLDNCEHVVHGAALLVAALIAAAPALRIVITSQVPLRLPDECLIRLNPLALPTACDLAAAAASGAVALFVARTTALLPRFELRDDNLCDVLEICRQLDGIPLALELAAARVPLLGAGGVRQRLHERFRLLTRSSAAGPSRHQTLQAALDWSHELLLPRDRLLLRRLSIFRGGFTAEAAQRLASDDTLDEWAVLDGLDELQDQSFVVAQPIAAHDSLPPEPRFTLLDTVRGYARRPMEGTSEEASLARRHAEIFAELARAHSGTVGGAQAGAQREHLTPDHDNLFAALDWCTSNDPVLGLRIAASVAPFWRERGHHTLALPRVAALLARTDAHADAEARLALLPRIAMMAQESGDAALLHRLADEALSSSRRLGQRETEGGALSLLGHAAWMEGDIAGARRLYAESLAIAREQGDLRRVAEALNNVASCLCEEGYLEEALPLLAEALPLACRSGHRWTEAAVLESMGELDFALGRLDSARGHFEHNLALQRSLQHAYRTVAALQLLARTDLQLKNLRPATVALLEALAIGRQHGFAMMSMVTVAVAAACLLAQGATAKAVLLLGAVDGHLPDRSAAFAPTERALYETAVAQSRGLLEEAAWQQQWRMGLRLTRDDVLAHASAALEAGVPAR